MRIIIAASLIFLFWFVLSGHTELLMILLGIASTLLTAFLSRRMNVIDHESYPFHLGLRLLRYYVFLGKEILIANIDVVKRIIKPGSTISPQVFELPATQKTDLSKVIYANSITLTPGTVTLALEGEKVIVHALSKEGAMDLQTGRMAGKVPDPEEFH
ncbi:MAG: Na+/H+ antiporter subunit E [Gammaproteobacteria bacterium]|nr:Na+/H+ antiporter subunit E [Gammaproteobacteria bacterium]